MSVEALRCHALDLVERGATLLQRLQRPALHASAPRTVFVLLGGGSRGAAQAGALTALLEAGVVPDAIIGISAGSWNGAYLSVEPSAERARRLEALWLATTSHDIIGGPRWASAFSLVAKRRSLYGSAGMRRVAARYLAGLEFVDLAVPLRIVAADLISGRAHLFADGCVLDAVMASSALPGVFPPVVGGDELLADGGMAEWAGCLAALELGATRICLVACGAQRPSALKLRGVWQLIERSIDLAYRDNFNRSTFALRAAGVDVLPIFPETPACSLLDFDHAAELVEAGRAAAEEALSSAAAIAGPRCRSRWLRASPAPAPTPEVASAAPATTAASPAAQPA